jgi:hypothetical protein
LKLCFCHGEIEGQLTSCCVARKQEDDYGEQARGFHDARSLRQENKMLIEPISISCYLFIYLGL